MNKGFVFMLFMLFIMVDIGTQTSILQDCVNKLGQCRKLTASEALTGKIL